MGFKRGTTRRKKRSPSSQEPSSGSDQTNHGSPQLSDRPEQGRQGGAGTELKESEVVVVESEDERLERLERRRLEEEEKKEELKKRPCKLPQDCEEPVPYCPPEE